MIPNDDSEKIANHIPSDELSPDEKVIRNQEYEKLSNEAKEVISTILNAPYEIISSLPYSRSRSNKLTKSKVKLYLVLKWNSTSFSKLIIKKFATSIIDEIHQWVKTL